MMFFGETTEYWLTLQKVANELDRVQLIRDLANAEAKIYRYEKLIKDMVLVRDEYNTET